MQLNCETEFEFLQLLDVLYYTDNSFKYKLFIKNLIYGLITNDVGHVDTKHEKEKTTTTDAKTTVSIFSSRMLSRISMMACDFMLPEFKLVKKVNWSSEMSSESDSGKLKNKSNSTALNEESINFSSSYSLKQAADIENGANLTSKPNDIEKISTNDSTLLIVFDTSNKAHQTLSSNSSSNNNNALNMMTNAVMSNPRVKKMKLNSFLKNTQHASTEISNYVLNKYLNNDDFETAKLDTTSSGEKKQDDDSESVDSLNYASLLGDKSANVASGESKLVKHKKFAFNDESKKESGDEVNEDDDEDDDEKEWQTSKKNSLKQKIKEHSGKHEYFCFSKLRRDATCGANTTFL